MTKLAILGAGKLGQTLIKGLIESGQAKARDITATTRHRETSEAVKKLHGVRTTQRNAEAAEKADVVIVSVKPQSVKDVLAEIRPVVGDGKLVISTMASVGTSAIEAMLGKHVPVVRTMPNTPCLLRAGMTGVAPGRYAHREHLERAAAIFRALGRVVIVDEKHMDAVTGLSASGPAFMYIVLESLAEGGVKVGLPRELATELAAQTMLGAAQMVLTTREHPAKLKDVVTTPAGCTIDGILELEEGGLRVALIKAIVKATKRAGELAQE